VSVREFVVAGPVGELAVEDHGGSGVPLVLLHGSGANVRAWDLLAPCLRPHFRVVAYDLRSHGRSVLSHDQSLTGNVADVEAVCAALDIERPLVLGHSWGVSIALGYALKHRECRGVVAVDGIVGPFLYGFDESWPELDEGLNGEPDLRTFAELESWLAEDQREVLGFGPEPSWEAWVPLFQRMFRPSGDDRVCAHPTPDEMRAIVMVQMGGLDPIELFHDTQAPIIVVGASGRDNQHTGALGGRAGTELRQQMLRRLHTLRPNLEEVWLSCGHSVPLEMPETLAKLTTDFAGRHDLTPTIEAEPERT
jgi:pimeloyl-ACP methyl ester carboxylesterase